MRRKVHITIISQNEKIAYMTNAIISDSSIIYFEDDPKKTKVRFNYNQNQLIRENKELSIKYNFKKNKTTSGSMTIHELGKSINLRVTTKDILRCNYNVKIKFTVEDEPIEYIIEVIE